MIRFLSDLSQPMSRGLLRCHTLTVLVSKDPRTYGIQPVTLRALERRGLVEQAQDKRARPVWKPSARGARLITTEEPRLLAARSQRGYTAEPYEAVFDEPEAVDHTTQERFSDQGRETDQLRHAGVGEAILDSLKRERDRRNLLVAHANRTGLDLRAGIKMIDRGIACLEREIRQQAGKLRHAA